MPCAVSGLKYAVEPDSSTGPTWVLNIKLNCRGEVIIPVVPHFKHFILSHFSFSILSDNSSARYLDLHCLQSTSGS